MATSTNKLLIILLILLSNSLFAQERDSTFILSPITVEGKLFPDHHSTENQQSWMVQETPYLNVVQVSDVLKFFSGVTVKDYGGIGGLKSVSVRGLGAHHTSLSYDGVRVNDAQSGQVDFGKYTLENVERVALVMGSPTDLRSTASDFSSGSMIKLNTIKPTFKGDSSWSVQAQFKGGSFQYWSPSVLFQQKLTKRVVHSSSVDFQKSKGDYPYVLKNGNIQEEVRRLNSSIQSFRAEENVFLSLSDKHNLSTKLYYYQSDRALPGPVIFYNTSSAQRLRDDNIFIQSHYQGELSSRLQLNIRAKYAYNHMHYTDPDYLGTIRVMDSRYKQQEQYGSVSLAYHITPRLQWGNATDMIWSSLKSNEDEVGSPQRIQSISASSLQFKNQHWLIQGGALYTRALDKSMADNRVRQRLSPYMSIGYYTDEDEWLIRFYYKDLYRLPTFNDLYYYAIGNSDLEPEKIKQFNFGVSRQLLSSVQRSISWSVDGYVNEVHDKIVALPTRNVYLWTMMNVGKASIHGLETSFNSQVKIHNRYRLFSDIKYTYQEVLDKTSRDGKTYNHQLAYTPRHAGSLVLGLESEFGNISYTILFAGKRYMLNQNIPSNVLHGYTEHSFSYKKDFSIGSGNLGVMGEILNLMNTQYEVVKNFPMPRRSFRVSIQYKLKK
jgi:vitamin B12 transporter